MSLVQNIAFSIINASDIYNGASTNPTRITNKNSFDHVVCILSNKIHIVKMNCHKCYANLSFVLKICLFNDANA